MARPAGFKPSPGANLDSPTVGSSTARSLSANTATGYVQDDIDMSDEEDEARQTPASISAKPVPGFTAIRNDWGSAVNNNSTPSRPGPEPAKSPRPEIALKNGFSHDSRPPSAVPQPTVPPRAPYMSNWKQYSYPGFTDSPNSSPYARPTPPAPVAATESIKPLPNQPTTSTFRFAPAQPPSVPAPPSQVTPQRRLSEVKKIENKHEKEISSLSMPPVADREAPSTDGDTQMTGVTDGPPPVVDKELQGLKEKDTVPDLPQPAPIGRRKRTRTTLSTVTKLQGHWRCRNHLLRRSLEWRSEKKRNLQSWWNPQKSRSNSSSQPSHQN